MHLAERKHNAAMARTAVLQIEAARDAMSEGRRLPFADYDEIQLKIARSVAKQTHGH